MKNEKIFYYSTSPKKYFLIPAEQRLEEGDFILQSFSGKMLKVKKEAIQPFKISTFEVRPYIEKELDDTVTRFRQTFSLDKAKKKEADQEDTLAEKLYEKIAGEKSQFDLSNVTGVLKDFGDAIKVLWDAGTTKEEAEAEAAREKIKAIRERLEAKGIKVSDKFEELPAKLRDKHKEGDPTLQESAEQLKETTDKLRTSLKEVFNAFRVNKKDTDSE